MKHKLDAIYEDCKDALNKAYIMRSELTRKINDLKYKNSVNTQILNNDKPEYEDQYTMCEFAINKNNDIINLLSYQLSLVEDIIQDLK